MPEFSNSANFKDNFSDVIANIKEPVAYFWYAVLKAGSNICQYNSDGSENLAKLVFDEEKKGNLDAVWWVPTKNPVSYRMRLQEGQRLILVRRGHVSITNGIESERKIVYMLGWQKLENEVYSKNILYIKEDGTTLESTNFEENFS